MSPTVSQVKGWDTGVLDQQAMEWDTAARTIGEQGYALDHESAASPEYWRGAAADSMRRSSDEISSDVSKLGNALNDGVYAARRGSVALGHAKSRVEVLVHTAESDRFTVSDDGSVSVPPQAVTWLYAVSPVKAAIARAALVAAAHSHEVAIKRALSEADEAASSAAENIAAAFHELPAAPGGLSGGDTVGAALSGQEGSDDGKSVASGHLTDEDRKRIGDHLADAQLTPGELAALERGETVPTVPASTIDYLHNFYNTAGKDGILSLADQYRGQESSGDPQAGRRLDGLANELLTLSNEKVGSGDSKGGYNQLPTDVRALINAGHDVHPNSLSVAGPGDIGRFGDLIGESTPGNQPGTELGVELDRVASNLAVTSEQSILPATMAGGSWTFERPMEQFLDVGSRNHDSSYHLLTGTDMDGSPADFKRDDVLVPLLTHEWQDDGKSAGNLVDWIHSDAHPADPANPLQIERAERAGNAAFGLSEVLSNPGDGNSPNRFDALINIPGADGQSIGQVNPLAAQSMSVALAPYVGDMVGSPEEVTGTRGFGDLGPVDATRVLTVLDSDPKAGAIINGAALAESQRYDRIFADQEVADGGHGTGDVTLGRDSGRLRGLVEAGLSAEAADRNINGEDAAQEVKEGRERAYGASQAAISGAIGLIPGGSLVSPVFDVGAELAKDDILGPDGRYVGSAPIPKFDEKFSLNDTGTINDRAYSMADSLVRSGHLDPSRLPDGVVADEGGLKPYSELDDSQTRDVANNLPIRLKEAGIDESRRLLYNQNATEGLGYVDRIVFAGHQDAKDAVQVVLKEDNYSESTNKW